VTKFSRKESKGFRTFNQNLFIIFFYFAFFASETPAMH